MRLLVRADASAAIGLGHAMRCLALAQALADEHGGAAAFLLADPPPAFAARAARDDCPVVELAARPGSAADAEETLATARDTGADWIVLDGYHFDARYQAALRDGGVRVLALDDHGHAGSYRAHVILNQNLGASEALYADRLPDTRLLLGSRHALLRREFRAWDAEPGPAAAVARRILVTLGGSDPDNVSTRVLEGLASLPGPFHVQVLAGGANPHLAVLEAAARRCPHPVDLAVDVSDVPERMAWADLAVAAAGGTSWELARVGTPQLAIVLADNQRPAGRALAAEGAAEVLGWHADVSSAVIGNAIATLAADRARRAALSARGSELIDGRGAARVLSALQEVGAAA